MPRTSAGLLMYRHRPGGVQILLVHPGGPFWKTRDAGAWTIPKGEIEPEEEPLAAAIREFEEEVGLKPTGRFLPIGTIRQRAGKHVHAWAVEGDCDPATIRSNTVIMQWPPRSGRWIEFPEIDRADFFDLPTAAEKINPAQIPLLHELQRCLLERQF